MICEFCGHDFAPECGRYGCPNCLGEGLDDLSPDCGSRRNVARRVKPSNRVGVQTVKPKPVPTNIRIDGETWGEVALSCDYQGAEYHVWVDPDAPDVSDRPLFKNVPDRRVGARMLAIDGATGRAILPAMLAALPDLVKARRAQLAAQAERAREENAAALREHRAREAGPALLDASVAFLSWFREFNGRDCYAEISCPEFDNLRAAIVNAGGVAP